jgi:3-oxoadipate enol-lactonase
MVDVMRVRVGSGELAVAQAGEGGRPLLLVHGFTGAKEDFGDWFDRLADDGWWVVAPDLRGHGDSHKPLVEAAYSLSIFADDVLGLADSLGWERFSLLGHSMGGMVAQVVAIRAPQRLDRLVLMDTHHGSYEGLDPELVAIGMDILRTQGLEALLALIDSMPADRAPAEERVRETRPGYVAFNERKLHAVSPAMYAAMGIELLACEDRLAQLAELDVPTRVLVGEQDKNFVDASERLAATVPGADLVVIADAAHSPQFENPDAWWDAVTTFLTADQPTR